MSEPRPFIPYDAYDWLVGFVKPHHRIFEYGSGKSTLWLGKNAGEVVAVDKVPHCYETCARELEEHGIHNVEYVLREDSDGYSKLIHEYEGQFDLVFIDGHFRRECMEECYNKAKYAIFMDNTDNPGYRDAYDVMKSFPDGEIIDFYSYGLNPYTGKELMDPKNLEVPLKWGAAVFLKDVERVAGKF
jgi:precorrin-6B methylase 2